MKYQRTLILGLGLMLLTSVAGAQTWVAASPGAPTPAGYVSGGMTDVGEVAICRATGSDASTYIGKVNVANNAKCKINCQGNKEAIESGWDVLTDFGGPFVDHTTVTNLAVNGVDDGFGRYVCQVDNGTFTNPGYADAYNTSCSGLGGGGAGDGGIWTVNSGYKILAKGSTLCDGILDAGHQVCCGCGPGNPNAGAPFGSSYDACKNDNRCEILIPINKCQARIDGAAQPGGVCCTCGGGNPNAGGVFSSQPGPCASDSRCTTLQTP